MKKLRSIALTLVVALLLLARPVFASYSGCVSLGVKQAAIGNHQTVTTDIADSSGLDTIFFGVSSYNNGTINSTHFTDSKANTWNLLSGNTAQATTNTRTRIAYCKACTVGGSHTFTFSVGSTDTYPTVVMLGCTGGQATAPADQEAGATTTGASSLATGNITPTEDNEIVVTIASDLDIGTVTTPTGFTLVDRAAYSAGAAIGGAMAYKIQTTAGAVNPSWGFTVSIEASVAAFSAKAAAGSSGATCKGSLLLLGAGGCH